MINASFLKKPIILLLQYFPPAREKMKHLYVSYLTYIRDKRIEGVQLNPQALVIYEELKTAIEQEKNKKKGC